MSNKQRRVVREVEPIVVDTYLSYAKPAAPSAWADKPSSFNGMVEVDRYRVTIERIIEPEEVAKRLQRLWDKCDNYHHWSPLEAAAKRIGYRLKGRAGSKRGAQ